MSALRKELEEVRADRDRWKRLYMTSQTGASGTSGYGNGIVAAHQFDTLTTQVKILEDEVTITHPYIHLAEDLLTLIPSLTAYTLEDGGWDFEAVSRAAEHKRNRDELEAFEAIVGVEQ